MSFVTEHLKEHAQSFAKVHPEGITADEKRLIIEGSLGYCEAHGNLYRKFSKESFQEEIEKHHMVAGFTECPVQSIVCKCPDPNHHPKIGDFPPCKEW